MQIQIDHDPCGRIHSREWRGEMQRAVPGRARARNLSGDGVSRRLRSRNQFADRVRRAARPVNMVLTAAAADRSAS